MDGDPYSCEGCAVYVDALGDEVLRRARALFALLDADGAANSDRVAAALGLARPQLIPGTVNTRLKTRASELAWPLPLNGGSSRAAHGSPRRTWWHDRGGVAGRMVGAIDDALADRQAAKAP